jgi:hypothetical protein
VFVMSDVIDRINLVTQGVSVTYSQIAQAELAIALDRSMPEERRLYAIGYHQGALVGLGAEGANRLRAAEALHFAERFPYQVVQERLTRHFFTQARRDEIIEASGVLMGYWEQTLDVPGAMECWWCNRRIVDGLDDYQTCYDGDTCPRCSETGVDHTRTCLREMQSAEYQEA